MDFAVKLCRALKNHSANDAIVLTHLLSQDPSLRLSIHFHKDGGSADEQHEQVGNAQVREEDVGGVPHILRFDNHKRHLEAKQRERRYIEMA